MFLFKITKNNKDREILLPDLSEQQAEDLARTVKDIYGRREYDFDVQTKLEKYKE